MPPNLASPQTNRKSYRRKLNDSSSTQFSNSNLQRGDAIFLGFVDSLLENYDGSGGYQSPPASFPSSRHQNPITESQHSQDIGQSIGHPAGHRHTGTLCRTPCSHACCFRKYLERYLRELPDCSRSCNCPFAGSGCERDHHGASLVNVDTHDQSAPQHGYETTKNIASKFTMLKPDDNMQFNQSDFVLSSYSNIDEFGNGANLFLHADQDSFNSFNDPSISPQTPSTFTLDQAGLGFDTYSNPTLGEPHQGNTMQPVDTSAFEPQTSTTTSIEQNMTSSEIPFEGPWDSFISDDYLSSWPSDSTPNSSPPELTTPASCNEDIQSNPNSAKPAQYKVRQKYHQHKQKLALWGDTTESAPSSSPSTCGNRKLRRKRKSHLRASDHVEDLEAARPSRSRPISFLYYEKPGHEPRQGFQYKPPIEPRYMQQSDTIKPYLVDG